MSHKQNLYRNTLLNIYRITFLSKIFKKKKEGGWRSLSNMNSSSFTFCSLNSITIALMFSIRSYTFFLHPSQIPFSTSLNSKSSKTSWAKRRLDRFFSRIKSIGSLAFLLLSKTPYLLSFHTVPKLRSQKP